MIEIATDIRNKCPKCQQYMGEYLRPATPDSLQELKGLKLFDTFKSRLYGIKKPRSVKQLNTYWSVCDFVAGMLSDHENIFTKDDIDFKTKIRVAKTEPKLMKRFQVVSGVAYVEPISIAFKNLKHLDACRYFDKAFRVMAGVLAIKAKKDKNGKVLLKAGEVLVLTAKEHMGK